MPEISRFFGIRVCMYHDDHAPPHFHAYSGEFHVEVNIRDGRVRGRFPTRALGLLLEWYHLHRDELEDNWDRAEAQLPLERIAPLS